jgi:hypothetical protein
MTNSSQSWGNQQRVVHFGHTFYCPEMPRFVTVGRASSVAAARPDKLEIDHNKHVKFNVWQR